MATNKGVWIKTWVVALFLSSLVTACGGGGDDGSVRQAQTAAVAGSSASNSTGHNAAEAVAAAGQRHLALAVRTPDATALFDWVERAFSQFFPSHRSNSQFDTYTFRYYPETGNYIAVAGSFVVVLGPVTDGRVVHVGMLADFACRVYPRDCSPAPAPGRADNGCFDFALSDTVGTNFVITYQKPDLAEGTVTHDSTVGNVTGFEGYANARETSIITTIMSGMTSAPGTSSENRIKVYGQRTGDAEFTGYGSTSSTRNLDGTSVVSKSVFSPPFVDPRYALVLGESESYTLGTITTTTTTRSIPGQPDSTSITSSTNTLTQIVKFVGRETVTVPAGTYSTCRFDVTMPGQQGSSNLGSSQWFIYGKGILVKTVFGIGVGVTLSEFASLIKLNGQKI